jgi:hypothetical protein
MLLGFIFLFDNLNNKESAGVLYSAGVPLSDKKNLPFSFLCLHSGPFCVSGDKVCAIVLLY